MAEHLGSVHLEPSYRYIWGIYRTLANRRRFNDGIPEAICFQEIQSYSQLTRTPLDAWEVSILTALDDYERGLLIAQRQKAQQASERRSR